MQKTKTLFICTHCDTQYPKWLGQCSECGKWGTIVESVATESQESKLKTPGAKPSDVVDLGKLETSDQPRKSTGISEVDRVLGGGIVPGTLMVLGGEPGVGKSTLALQIATSVSGSVLYASGEESARQVQDRMKRLVNVSTPSGLSFVSEQQLDKIIATCEQHHPEFVVLDSIQMVYTDAVEGEPGSVSQIRACAARLMEFCKRTNTAMVLIGHVTKEGSLGGPKTLEHLVDVVMYLEGDRQHMFRILRCVKNRFGSTSEIGVFDLTSSGLQEVKNPSQFLLSLDQEKAPGSVLTVMMEGARPFLMELQALVSRTVFGYPVRKASGLDLNRLQLLTAVVTQRGNIPLHTMDIYVNSVGGVPVRERASDLAVACALVSAWSNSAIPVTTVLVGEVGLSGEVRPVPRLDSRLKEAAQLSMTDAVIPLGKTTKSSLKLHQVRNLREAFQHLGLTKNKT